MANDGPPGANRPEPWHGQPSGGAYPGHGQPPGAAYPWHGLPSGGTYPAHLGGGPDQQPWDIPRTPGGRGRLVAVLALLALLVLGGGATLFYLATTDDDPSPVTALPSTTAGPSGQSPARPDVSADVSPSALAPESSADPRFARVGQCVRNDGPADGRPKLVITKCAPKTYEVLRRFDEATSGEQDAEVKCADVDGYTDWYFYNSELDTLDFVLCLKLR